MFDRKIIAMQTDWVANMSASIPSFALSAFPTLCPVHMHINRMVLQKENNGTSLRWALLF
jgi:hypothetical protein